MAIPNITYTDESFFPIMIYGIEKTEIVGLSIIGTLNNPTLVKSAIKYVVDNLKCLKTIIVYTSSTDNVKIKKLFTYAKQNKIKIIIPKNTLLERNKTKVNGKI